MEQYGRLTFLADAGRNKHGRKLWQMRCACGNIAVVDASAVRTGHTKSCGCLQKNARSNLRHGQRQTRLYTIWCNMKARCDNPKNPAYANYGGRGVHYAPAWGSFAAFAEAVGNAPSTAYTLDRIDNDGNYEPGNVRWALRYVQARNTRQNVWVTLNGKTKCLHDWCAEFGVTPATVYKRMAAGEAVESALTRKSRKVKGE